MSLRHSIQQRTRQRTRLRTSLVIGLAVGCVMLGGGCTSTSRSTGSPSRTNEVSTANPPALPTPGTGVFGQASAVACATDRNLVETAVESYLALHGGHDVTEDQLVSVGLLEEPSHLHDLGPGEAVVASPQGGCID